MDCNTLTPVDADLVVPEEDLPPVWPTLDTLGLSRTALSDRLTGIGGSDANVILSGDAGRVLKLWQEKRGEIGSEDLSGVLPVMLGSWTEAFNRQWYERQTGFAVSDVGLVAICAEHPWRRATLDGLVEVKGSIWEAKHTGGFVRPEDVLARYMPQLQHNMAVLGLGNAVLSVIYGNHKWEVYEIARDWMYQDDLLRAEQHFWTCVKTGEPPATLPPLAPPRPVATRELCLEGSNAWAVAAGDWLDNGAAAHRYAEASKALKALLDDDVVRAWGHGVEAKRSKAGAVTIRELLA